tara:strand:+ start:2890 stop:3552 length:663 start_codon:yes stop_codon:yes gene_type:complete
MNSFTNSLLIFFTIPLLFLAIYIGLDVQINFLHISGSSLPYQEQIFIGFAIIYFILLVWRSVRRWMGMFIVNKADRFKWNKVVSRVRLKRIILYTFLEAAIMSSIGIAIHKLTGVYHPPAIVLFAFSIENIIFLIVGSRDRFRVGISSKAVIVADREVTIGYFSGLREITLGTESIYFDYIKNLQLSFPTDCIDDEHIDSFRSSVKSVIDPDRVFVRNKY